MSTIRIFLASLPSNSEEFLSLSETFVFAFSCIFLPTISYGGATKAGKAAAVIQQAFRRHCMVKNFAKLRLEADERWRFNQQNGGSRPLSDFTRSRTMWTEHGSAGIGFGMGASAATKMMDDEYEDNEAALSSAVGADYDVMTHSFSADNMLTLTRRSHHHHAPGCRHASNAAGAVRGKSPEHAKHRQRRQVAFSEESNSVVVVDSSGTGGSTAPYFSSGDSSDEGGSARASPVPGIDPTSADFETALEAGDDAADNDSFESTDEEDDGDFLSSSYSPSVTATTTPSPVRRAADMLQVYQQGNEMYVGGTEVRLRRKKVDAIPVDEAALMSVWKWKNSTTSSSSDGDHSNCLSDVIENFELFNSAATSEYPTLMSQSSCKENTLSSSSSGNLSRTCDREVVVSAETAVNVQQLSTTPNAAAPSQMSERLRKRTYRIGLNLFNKYVHFNVAVPSLALALALNSEHCCKFIERKPSWPIDVRGIQATPHRAVM